MKLNFLEMQTNYRYLQEWNKLQEMTLYLAKHLTRISFTWTARTLTNTAPVTSTLRSTISPLIRATIVFHRYKQLRVFVLQGYKFKYPAIARR